MLLAVIATVVGLVVLVKAADVFVDAAVALAEALDVSPVVIGALIVGFGTSVPELLVSGLAAGQDDRALGVGNIVGSNVANLSLVLGCAGLLATIRATGAVRRRELPLSFLATAGFAGVALDGGITRLEGAVLAAALAGVLAVLTRLGPPAADLLGPTEELAAAGTTAGGQVVRCIGGLVATAAGAQLAVWGAGDIADRVGLSGGFIGFSLVALGTSLPELVTAINAVRKGETELVVGNLLGSNIFNSLAVGAVIGFVGPGPVGDDVLTGFGLAAMMAVAVIASVLLIGVGVRRGGGAVLIVAWVVALAGLSTSEEETDDEAASATSVSAGWASPHPTPDWTAPLISMSSPASCCGDSSRP